MSGEGSSTTPSRRRRRQMIEEEEEGVAPPSGTPRIYYYHRARPRAPTPVRYATPYTITSTAEPVGADVEPKLDAADRPVSAFEKSIPLNTEPEEHEVPESAQGIPHRVATAINSFLQAIFSTLSIVILFDISVLSNFSSLRRRYGRMLLYTAAFVVCLFAYSQSFSSKYAPSTVDNLPALEHTIVPLVETTLYRLLADRSSDISAQLRSLTREELILVEHQLRSRLDEKIDRVEASLLAAIPAYVSSELKATLPLAVSEAVAVSTPTRPDSATLDALIAQLRIDLLKELSQLARADSDTMDAKLRESLQPFLETVKRLERDVAAASAAWSENMASLDVVATVIHSPIADMWLRDTVNKAVDAVIARIRAATPLSTADYAVVSTPTPPPQPHFTEPPQPPTAPAPAPITSETKPVKEGYGDVDIDALVAAVAQHLLASDRGVARPDWALASAGGTVVTDRTSKTYEYATEENVPYVVRLINKVNPFRSTIARPPTAAITADTTVGNCWAFDGSNGYITIRLARAVVVSHVTLEHVSPKIAHDVRSAPRDFSVWGIKHPDMARSGVLLGNFTYTIHSDMPIQTFEVEPSTAAAQPFGYVVLHVRSNWGHEKYTCIYRFRVHGTPIRQYGVATAARVESVQGSYEEDMTL